MKKKHHNQSSLITVENFSFDYDHHKEKPLLKDINLSLGMNETLLLVGPSGSGKSTLSLCLNGLYPDAVEGWKSGSVYYEGKNVNKYEKGKINQQIGIVFQDPESQFCMITVEDELAFTMENINIPREEMKERMIDVLQKVDLSEELKRPIHQLSGGQKQRVALASVLLLEPSLLILDEPTSNLDPATRLSFINLIEQLKKLHHLSIVIIEHQLDDWIPLVDRVVALNKNGEMIADGAPRDVFYDQYNLLHDEGIHLPRVINNIKKKIDIQEVSKEHLPLTETELADFLYKNDQKTYSNTHAHIEKETKSHHNTLNFKNISFTRRQEKILNNIDLDIQEGEFIGIVGKNGAGKSTLLQLLAGILSPDSGERTFLGKDYQLWDEQNLRKNMGFVFQNPEHQFITNTVFDELAFGMKLVNQPEQEINQQVNELLEKFGLEDHRWSNPFALSGGQKRRLSVATMLHETPKLLLFDEPTFGQDAKTTGELMKVMNQLRKNGTAIVFVTHDMDLVDQYCERVFVLDGGEIVFKGAPEKLWKDPYIVAKAHLRLPYHIRLQKKVKKIIEENKHIGGGEHDYVKVY